MKIAKNAVVSFHYELSVEGSDYRESSEGREPAGYLHGYSGIVRGLERAMRGREAGEEFEVTVAPEDAYGVHDPERVQQIPVKHLVKPGRLVPGKIVVVNLQRGHTQAIVRKVGRFNVIVDFNHPLSGHVLHFKVRIINVRDARPEEIRQRRALSARALMPAG